jgi:hypothetical protein
MAERELRATTIKERKVRAFLGAIVGEQESMAADLEVGGVHGRRLDWRAWARYMMPEFAVVFDETWNVPRFLIVTDTGEAIPIDKSSCHPSDAFALLAGSETIRAITLIEALDSTITDHMDGDRRTNALALVNRLRRLVASGM